jgi:hypothetical protein
MKCLTALSLCCVLVSGVASAQVVSRPTDPPIVTAENDSWYRLREPVLFAGDEYYPAGATVFFNGNTMVRTGHYNGVPLYADTTLEPYSVVFVPIGRGLLQPYERVRRGELAGTSGSRTPSFPVRSRPDAGGPAPAAAAVPPTAVMPPAATVSPAAPPRPAAPPAVFTAETGAVGTSGLATPVAVGTGGVAVTRAGSSSLATVRRAESNDGVWLQFMGAKWVSAGPVVPLRAAEFVRVGEYAGFPVYARKGLDEDTIYLPSSAGLIAPYKLKD